MGLIRGNNSVHSYMEVRVYLAGEGDEKNLGKKCKKDGEG